MRTLTITAGILLFLAAATLPSHAARATTLVSAPGPMTGAWKIKVKNVHYKTSDSKPTTENGTLTATFTDADGDQSPLTMAATDNDGNPINLSGQRVRHAFFLQSQDGKTYLHGLVTGNATTAKALTASGGETDVDKIGFITATGKRTGP